MSTFGGKTMILLFSGGIDSYIAWHFLEYPPVVYFDLNTPYSKKEMIYLSTMIPDVPIEEDTINLRSRQEGGDSAYIPFRNLYLAMLAVNYSDTIVIAGVKGDSVSDKNPEAFQKMSDLLSDLEQRPIKIVSPFWEMTKDDIVKWHIENIDPDRQGLFKTVSCYTERNTNYCGMCRSCFRKWNALYNNGYKIDFNNVPMMKEYYNRALNGQYDMQRNESIIHAVKTYLRLK
jgi:7-cyano-7-deazaguanine synthase